MAKNELIKLCDELDECSKKLCANNEIVCAKKKLQGYFGTDKNKYLKLKAQIKLYDTNRVSVIDYIIKIATIGAFLLTIIYNLSDEEKVIYGLYAFCIVIIIFILSVLNIFYRKKDEKIEMWIRYIEFAIDDIAKDNKWL